MSGHLHRLSDLPMGIEPHHPLDGHGPQSQSGLLVNREIFCPSQEVTPVQPAVNLKTSHFPRDHSRLACGSAKPLTDCETALSQWQGCIATNFVE